MKELLELEIAIQQSRLPPHLITCITHSINLFEGDIESISRFIVDMQREAFKRTNSGMAMQLAEELARKSD